MDDDAVKRIVSILKDKSGLTITEIVDLSKLSRSSVRTSLAKLEGGNKVDLRNIGMAKVYSLRGAK